MEADRYLLTFIVALEARDRIVDLLMGDTTVSGFTVTDSQGFSREHSAYDIGEQIAGFRRMCRFEIIGERAALESLLERLGQQKLLSRHQAGQWISPVI